MYAYIYIYTHVHIFYQSVLGEIWYNTMSLNIPVCGSISGIMFLTCPRKKKKRVIKKLFIYRDFLDPFSIESMFCFVFFLPTLIDPHSPKQLLKTTQQDSQARPLSCTSPFSFSTAKASGIISPWQRQVTLWELVSYVSGNKLQFKAQHYLCRGCSCIQILKELLVELHQTDNTD